MRPSIYCFLTMADEPVCLAEDFSSYDIGLAVKAGVNNLSDSDKFDFITKLWRPVVSFSFPESFLNHRLRSFQYLWLLKPEYKCWLSYLLLPII